MFSKLAFVLCFILSLYALVVQAAHVPSRTSRSNEIGDTNGERLRRGLPPLAPSFKKMKKRGTPVAAAKRYVPSNAPPKTYTGNIKIKKKTEDDTVTVGYVNKALDSSGLYTIYTGSTSSNRLSVSFAAAASGSSSQIDIRDTSNSRASTPFMGGVGGNSLSSGSANFVSIAGVAQTTGGAPPQTGSRTTNSGSIESAIWAYNPNTDAITVLWINPNGVAVTGHIVYDPNSFSGGGLVITGDVTQYRNSHSGSYEVFFYLD